MIAEATGCSADLILEMPADEVGRLAIVVGAWNEHVRAKSGRKT
jgi:hypothetical protein